MKWGLELETLKEAPLGARKLSTIRDGADPSSVVASTETRPWEALAPLRDGGMGSYEIILISLIWLSVYRNLFAPFIFQERWGRVESSKTTLQVDTKLTITNKMGSSIKNCISAAYLSTVVISNTCAIVWVAGWTTHFFHECHFYLNVKREINYGYSDVGILKT